MAGLVVVAIYPFLVIVFGLLVSDRRKRVFR
jgi:hypothetical protein